VSWLVVGLFFVDWFATAIDALDGPASAGVACVLAAAGLAALAARKPSLRGTTLVAAWYWSVVSLSSVALCEIAIGLNGSPSAAWIVPLRFAAAMTTFCPIMAVLGAKRPQDRPWQFIVLSLWIILSLPSVEWLLFGGVQEIHPARFWFLVVLTLVGAINGVATRFWLSSLLVSLGQMALVAPYLPATQPLFPGPTGPLAGLLAVVAAWSLLALGTPRPRRSATAADRVWLDFRDAFGTVWAVRVAERINASASMVHWPVTLAWRGFQTRADHRRAEEIPAAVIDSLRTLLRRFVSPGWLDARLGTQTTVEGEVLTKPAEA
jgi:hypothetical protein